MSADQYLQQILDREAVDNGTNSPVRDVQITLDPIIRHWAGTLLSSVDPSGSFAKGTANRSGTDIDLFISLSSSTTSTLKEIYESLFERMDSEGYKPQRQNVSINISVGSYDVDLVPAKRQDFLGQDHSLYRRRADSWTKTNVHTHITRVAGAGRQDETRLLKLWRNQNGLDFPSFYLELTVISALTYTLFGSLSDRVVTVFRYLRDGFVNARVVDPANTNNIISDDLTAAEKARIKAAAEKALSSSWDQVIR